MLGEFRDIAVNSGIRAMILLLDIVILPLDFLGMLSPRFGFWEEIRKKSSRILGFVDERAGPREVKDSEFVASVPQKPVQVERKLYAEGFTRNLFSRLKTRDGRMEKGSWALRKGLISVRQLHLMLFESEDGGTDIYAHEEYSSTNPLVAIRHFKGETQDFERGVEIAHKYI